ncbi:hypothetical protein ACGYK6_08675 [Sulfitobacter sp. 1A15333]|uniref:hypothetical protein n=1 Tax=Sulfitobacter sp. 1A15333 TaxID=3368570 RepID=UPI00374739E7
MARIKSRNTEPDDKAEPRLADELRRFTLYAADLVENQRRIVHELEAAGQALASSSKSYEKTSRAIARREAEGITIHLSADIEKARKDIALALTEPLARAEALVRETRLRVVLNGFAGGAVGAIAVASLLFFIKL